MKALKLLVVLLVACSASLMAQSFNPIKYEEYKLKNGLTVILHTDRTAPTAMTYLLYKVGSKDEDPNMTGFAHFFEHLMFEGTANIKRGTLDKLITAAGGQFNASTSFDQTDFYIKVPIHQLQLALWMESERMMSLVIDSIGIETQRKVVKEELKQRYEGRPYGTLMDNLFKSTFKGTQYQWTPIGTPEHINKASTQQFLDFHSKFYIPKNACLVVGGDLDIAQTKKWIKDYFEPIPAGTAPKRIPVVIPEQKESREMTVEEKMTPLPAIIESYLTVGQRHKDAYALEFLSDILSNGRSSRLYQRLVDQDQLAIQAGAFPFALEKSGLFAFFCIANQGVEMDKIRTTIKDELDKVLANGVTEEEFQKARNNKEAEFAQKFMSLDGKLGELARASLFYGDTKLVNEEYRKYMAVTRDDIKRVANTYLKPARMNTVLYTVMQQDDKANEN